MSIEQGLAAIMIVVVVVLALLAWAIVKGGSSRDE